MLEFGNTVYTIDLDAFDRAITTGTATDNRPPVSDKEVKTTLNGSGDIQTVEVFERTFGKTKEVDSVKYDLLKTFIEYLMDFDEVTDDSLGVDRALNKTSLGFKVVFNTLIQEGILVEQE